ncbi:MAG: hypothetical protein AAF228_02480 [Pseudomonadota bacterium]
MQKTRRLENVVLGKTIAISISAVFIAGCSSFSERLTFNNMPTFGILKSHKKVELDGKVLQQVTLTSTQVKLVHDSVKQVLPDLKKADFPDMKAVSYDKRPGIHVCGSVQYSNTVNQNNKTLPYYVELRKEPHRHIIYRGQLGTEPSKSSKIEFVCRYHKKV